MILTDPIVAPEPVDCGGLLVIGDPHVGSRRPGRRVETDWPAPILAKLDACAEIANAGDLQAVFLGDLFDAPVEPDERLKARLVRLLKRFRRRPLSNVGNHDIANAALSDGDTLATFALADVLDVVARSGPVAQFRIDGRRIGLGMTPYGQSIPTSIAEYVAGTEASVWLTHHDIAFGASYPGAVAPFPIEGCDLVVNGHVHASKPPVDAGGTVWCNPGNITRQSADLAGHEPRAWILGADLALRPVALPHARDAFDLTGRLVPAVRNPAAERLESTFVSLLQAEAPADLGRTDDAAYLREAMEARFAEEKTPKPLQALLRSLLAEAVERHGA